MDTHVCACLGVSGIFPHVENVAFGINSAHIPGEILKDFVHVFPSINSGFEGICRFLRPKTLQAFYLAYVILMQLSLYSTQYFTF